MLATSTYVTVGTHRNNVIVSYQKLKLNVKHSSAKGNIV